MCHRAAMAAAGCGLLLNGEVLDVEVQRCRLQLTLGDRVYRAVQRQLQAAIADLARAAPDITVTVTETDVAVGAVGPRADVVITGDDQARVVLARQRLELAVAGKAFAGCTPRDMEQLMSPAGKEFIMGLEDVATFRVRRWCSTAGCGLGHSTARSSSGAAQSVCQVEMWYGSIHLFSHCCCIQSAPMGLRACTRVAQHSLNSMQAMMLHGLQLKHTNSS